MIRIFKVALVLFFGLFISCKKDDDVQAQTPMIPYGLQYPVDIAAIEKYLEEYSMDVSEDGKLDVIFTKIPVGNPNGLISIKDQTEHPLQFKMVNSNGVDYKVYYINISGHDDDTAPYDNDFYGVGKKPTSVDSVFVSYKGRKLDNVVFDQTESPAWLVLDIVQRRAIEGWKAIIPLFKTGTPSAPSPTGEISYSGFGAGIMFLPSGLGYYQMPAGDIPAYSPLIFTFKLKGLNYVDNDYDGIDSKDEDINGDGIYLDDTDGDNSPDFYDQDDDGDGYLTKAEIRKPTPILAGQGPSYFYPFNAFTVANDPATPEDESVTKSEPKGIPDASGDGTTSTRLRRHRDRAAIPPYTTY